MPRVLSSRSWGLIYAVLEKPQEAIQANQQAIRKTPKSFVGYHNLGRLYSGGGKARGRIKGPRPGREAERRGRCVSC